MPPPPSKQKSQNSASMGGGGASSGRTSVGGKMGVSSGKMGAASSQKASPAKTGSGQIGSKGGGASQQKPGQGQNAGRVTAPALGAAKTTAQQSRNTALGKVSQAAKANVKGSGTSTQFGGRAMSSPLTAPNGSYYGPKGGNALNTDARLAAARSVGFSQPAIRRTPGDAEMLGRMMMAESGTIRNAFGVPRTDGLQGVADVVRNRVLSDRFPNTVPQVLTQRKQFSPIADGSFRRTPPNAMSTRVAEAVLSGEQPPVVGNALNYANIDTVNNLRGYSSAATRRAFNSMTPDAVIADASNPRSRSHTFGTIGRPSDVAFGGPAAYSPGAPAAMSRPVQMASAVPTTIPRPSPRPADLRSPVPRPSPRPSDLITASVAQNPFDTQRAFGVPRARPPGIGPERIMGVENYIDPASTVTQNPYEARARAQYAGYGNFTPPGSVGNISRNAYDAQRPIGYVGPGDFNVPDRTAPLSRNAFDSRAPAPVNLGYGPASPLGNMPAPERPKLVNQKLFYDRVASSDGLVPAFTKDQPRIASLGPVPASAPPPPQGVTLPGPMPPAGTPPLRMSPFGNVGQEYHRHQAPPTPWQYRNEAPPAAPNVGTPGSQTAQADTAPTFWQQGTDLFNQASTAVKEQVAPKANEYFDAVKKVGLPGVTAYANQQSGQAPASITSAGPGARNPMEVTASQAMMGQPAPAAAQPSPTELMALLEAMRLKGATPEEMAFVQSLISEQAA
jgi:spore germination cell wall hydrolase CwlJ-like protein